MTGNKKEFTVSKKNSESNTENQYNSDKNKLKVSKNRYNLPNYNTGKLSYCPKQDTEQTEEKEKPEKYNHIKRNLCELNNKNDTIVKKDKDRSKSVEEVLRQQSLS